MTGKKHILNSLEELARQLDIRIRYEKTVARGGLCKHRGKYQIIVDPKSTIDFKIDTIATALRTFNMNDIFVSPAMRDLLESYGHSAL